jgi:hypothetical protein
LLLLFLGSASTEGETTSAVDDNNARHRAAVKHLFDAAPTDTSATGNSLPRSRLLAGDKKRRRRDAPDESVVGIGTDKKKLRRIRNMLDDATSDGPRIETDTETECKKVIEGDPIGCVVVCVSVTSVTRDDKLIDEYSQVSQRKCEEEEEVDGEILDRQRTIPDTTDYREENAVAESQETIMADITTSFSFGYLMDDERTSIGSLSEITTDPVAANTFVSSIDNVDFIATTNVLLVDRMYTYGAPSVVKDTSASDQTDACMPGIRVFTEDIDLIECSWYEYWCTPGRQITNVDFASQINVKLGFHHPKIDTLIIQLVGGTDVEYISHLCNSDESTVEGYQWLPEASLPGSVIVNNHGLLEEYETRLARVPYSVQESSLDFISVPRCLTHDSFDEIKYCLNNYSSESYLKLEGVAGLGWETFAFMSVESGTDKDQAYVLKNDADSSRRRCIISFQSTDSLSDAAIFFSSNNAVNSYCGRNGVHTGTSNELRRFTRDSQWNGTIIPALETCHDVTCVGHSLGGSLCNLLTICANHGWENLDGSDDEENWDDYTTLIWNKPS